MVLFSALLILSFLATAQDSDNGGVQTTASGDKFTICRVIFQKHNGAFELVGRFSEGLDVVVFLPDRAAPVRAKTLQAQVGHFLDFDEWVTPLSGDLTAQDDVDAAIGIVNPPPDTALITPVRVVNSHKAATLLRRAQANPDTAEELRFARSLVTELYDTKETPPRTEVWTFPPPYNRLGIYIVRQSVGPMEGTGPGSWPSTAETVILGWRSFNTSPTCGTGLLAFTGGGHLYLRRHYHKCSAGEEEFIIYRVTPFALRKIYSNRSLAD